MEAPKAAKITRGKKKLTSMLMPHTQIVNVMIGPAGYPLAFSL
jgi:hypothetical protein